MPDNKENKETKQEQFSQEQEKVNESAPKKDVDIKKVMELETLDL